MTSCLVGGSFTSKGSLENFSALSFLYPDTIYEVIKTKPDPYNPFIVVLAEFPGIGSFKIRGNLLLTDDGYDNDQDKYSQINWSGSRASSLHYKDFTDKSKNFKIVDFHPGFIQSFDDPVVHALNHGFEYRGTKRDDTIDLSSLVAENLEFPVSLSGGKGADTMIGSDGKDLIAASTSRAICDFGSGTDLSIRVKDVLTGGSGVDIFYVDNGTKVTDVEVGETLHLYNHLSNDLRDLADKSPIIKYRPTKTVIKLGDIRVVTNPVEFEYHYEFLESGFEFCRTDQDGVKDCSRGLIPGQPEGYVFTAI